MTILGQISSGASEPEKLVGVLAVIGLLGFVIWKTVREWFQAPTTPDPWDDQVKAELARDDAVPLCHHCLTPHSEAVDFCPDCGAAVGKYTNWLPYPQLFSVGHVLRIGTFGKFKRTPMTILGFWLFSLGEYLFFAPIYWFILLKNLAHNPKLATPQTPLKDENAPKPS